MAKKEKVEECIELIPQCGEQDIAQAIYQLFDLAIADKENLGLPAKWHRFYELGKNRHWRSNNPNLSLISANLLHTHRRRIVNLLTDNNPTFNVRAASNDDQMEEKTNKILRTAEHWWNEMEQQSILSKSITKGETYGVCIEKLRFDINAEYGIGEVVTDVVDPFNFAIYPPKVVEIPQAEACFHFYPISVRRLKRMFPEKAEMITSDYETYKDDFGDSRREVSGLDMKNTIGTGQTTFGGSLVNLVGALGTGDEKSDEALVIECWVKDYTIVSEEIRVPVKDELGRTSPDAYETVMKSRPLYDGFIRCITVCNSTVVLADRSNPSINPNLPRDIAVKTYLYDKFPFNKATSNNDSDIFWGESDFEQLANLQMEIDKSISQYATLKDKVAGVKIINPKTSGVANSQFANGVNIIRPETTINHGIQYMDPPPIPPDLLNSLDVFRDLFFMVAGSFDLEQAQGEGSQVIAYKAIAALIENAATMIRGKIRAYGKLIRERGRMYISLAQNWYTEDRIVSYDQDGQDKVFSITGRDFDFQHKLMVVSGSTMPRSQIQVREEALELFKAQAIDNEELLKQLDYPNYRDVVTRMKTGPIDEFINNLEVAGTPPEILDYLRNISTVDTKKLERAVERHEIPFFTEVFNIEGMNEDPKKQLEIDKLTSEVEESSARTGKMNAEVKKINESIRQEDDKIKIERAKSISDIKKNVREESAA